MINHVKSCTTWGSKWGHLWRVFVSKWTTNEKGITHKKPFLSSERKIQINDEDDNNTNKDLWRMQTFLKQEIHYPKRWLVFHQDFNYLCLRWNETQTTCQETWKTKTQWYNLAIKEQSKKWETIKVTYNEVWKIFRRYVLIRQHLMLKENQLNQEILLTYSRWEGKTQSLTKMRWKLTL